jgi:hypothetical protein
MTIRLKQDRPVLLRPSSREALPRGRGMSRNRADFELAIKRLFAGSSAANTGRHHQFDPLVSFQETLS